MQTRCQGSLIQRCEPPTQAQREAGHSWARSPNIVREDRTEFLSPSSSSRELLEEQLAGHQEIVVGFLRGASAG